MSRHPKINNKQPLEIGRVYIASPSMQLLVNYLTGEAAPSCLGQLQRDLRLVIDNFKVAKLLGGIQDPKRLHGLLLLPATQNLEPTDISYADLRQIWQLTAEQLDKLVKPCFDPRPQGRDGYRWSRKKPGRTKIDERNCSSLDLEAFCNVQRLTHHNSLFNRRHITRFSPQT